jgi:DNA-binding CsgD family transcriptional regulator
MATETTSLTSADYQAILRGIERINRAGTINELRRTIIDVIAEAVPAIHVTYNELDVRAAKAVAIFQTPDVERATQSLLPVFERFMGQHPVLTHVARRASTGLITPATRISDRALIKHFYTTELYNECYRKLGTDFQIILPISHDQTVIGVAVSRDKSDFTERERIMLDAFAPHVRAAFERAHQRQRVQAVLEPDDEETGARILCEIGVTLAQARVLFWILQGKTSPEIALILGIKPRTIDKHTEHIFQTLRVSTRAAAVNTVLCRMLKV